MISRNVWLMVVEVLAAVAGASIGVGGLAIAGASRQNQTGRDSLVRLTSAVDNLATRMDVLHTDLRLRDQEIFARISELERSVARLEGHSDRN
jgi:outer membrane murein-binding lipoprotein Lpp